MIKGHLKKIQSLIVADIKNIRRDEFLSYIVVIPLAMGVLMRWLVPYLTDVLEHYGVDLTEYYALIASYFFVLMIPAIIGFINGFIWIDERDQQTLQVLKVSPLPFTQYLFYKVAAGMALSVLLVILSVKLSDFAYIRMLDLLLVASLGAFTAPFFALILFIFAKNKVEAFAYSKYMYVLYLVPIAAYFMDTSWEFLFYIIPTYWILKLHWVLTQGIEGAWLYYVIGVAYHLLILSVLSVKLKKSV